MSANNGSANSREAYLTTLQNTYGITAVEADTDGIAFLFDREREELVLMIPDIRVKEIGTSRCNHAYGIRLRSDEVVGFAKELAAVYNQWFIDLPTRNGITVEEAMGFRRKRGRRKRKDEE